MFDKNFVPQKPFNDFKWKWACLQCTEGINDPVVLLGVLFRMKKLEGRYKYSSDEFAQELVDLSKDIKDSIGVDLARRTGERNLIRNSGQYWRAVGLIPQGDRSGIIRLTEFGRRVAEREISQTEFSAITVQTFKLPNVAIQSNEECLEWESHSLIIYPLRIILEIILQLYNRDSRTGFITTEELTKIIIPLSGVHAKIEDYINFISWYREGKLNLAGWPNCCTEANDFRIAREFLLFLQNYGFLNRIEDTTRENERYFINTVILDEIIAILNTPITDNSLQLAVEQIRTTNIASEVERKRVQGTYRPNQAMFRKAVLAACSRCVITNVTMPEVLEAAHIKPFKYKGEDTVANGFAMRTDIHLLFDAGHLRIAPDGIVELSNRARMDYGATIPPRIVIPDFTNKEFLRWRWENYNGI